MERPSAPGKEIETELDDAPSRRPRNAVAVDNSLPCRRDRIIPRPRISGMPSVRPVLHPTNPVIQHRVAVVDPVRRPQTGLAGPAEAVDREHISLCRLARRLNVDFKTPTVADVASNLPSGPALAWQKEVCALPESAEVFLVAKVSSGHCPHERQVMNLPTALTPGVAAPGSDEEEMTFRPSPMPTVGVELELQILDRDSGDLAPGAVPLLKA
jgi:hypothetical protein